MPAPIPHNPNPITLAYNSRALSSSSYIGYYIRDTTTPLFYVRAGTQDTWVPTTDAARDWLRAHGATYFTSRAY